MLPLPLPLAWPFALPFSFSSFALNLTLPWEGEVVVKLDTPVKELTASGTFKTPPPLAMLLGFERDEEDLLCFFWRRCSLEIPLPGFGSFGSGGCWGGGGPEPDDEEGGGARFLEDFFAFFSLVEREELFASIVGQVSGGEGQVEK